VVSNAAERLEDKIAFLAAKLEAHGIPYAVGDAISLLYWGEPRATLDIDVNIFLPSTAAQRVADALVSWGVTDDSTPIVAAVRATAQVRVDYHGSFLDLFFSDVPFHDSCAERAVRVPFGDIEMNVLSAEDLVVCKVMFNRPKDWVDIEQMVAIRGRSFDAAYVRRWLTEMLGTASERLTRLDQVVAQSLADRA
jgi:predicted nucleotidyltransferase